MTLTLVTLSILAATTMFATGITVILLRLGWPKRLELQGPKRRYGTFSKRLPLILFNLSLLFIGPACVLPWVGFAFSISTPTIMDIVGIPLIILVFDDTLFYFWHRFLHRNKWMYRKVHRLHHKAFAPLPLDYIYAHPAEWVTGTLGPITGLICIYLISGPINAWGFWVFAVVRQLHEINIHSGTRSYFLKYAPNISDTESHDYHHARPNDGNYASIFEHWDRLCQTKVDSTSL